MDLDTTLQFAEETARYVGSRINEHFLNPTNLEINFKGTTDIVTEVDIWAEDEIKKRVSKSFSSHIVVGEETSAELAEKSCKSLQELCKAGPCWVVDPIDGTSNFANAIPHSAVSLALLVDGVRQLAVAYDPARDELFSAIRGKGAFRSSPNGRKKISVGKQTELIRSLVATGFPYDRHDRWTYYTPLFEKLTVASRSVRVTGSAVLDQCWVACGRLDGFVEYNLRPWDVAGGSLIVEEAGGKIGNFAEDEIEEFSIFGRSFLFANDLLYKELLTLSQEASKLGK